MLEFGTENTEINQYSNLAPFVISIKDDPDNQLSIIIALPSPVNSKTGLSAFAPYIIIPSFVPLNRDMKRLI